MFFDNALADVNARLNIRWPDKAAYGTPESYIKKSLMLNAKPSANCSTINEMRHENGKDKDIMIINNNWKCDTIEEKGKSTTYIDQDLRFVEVTQTAYNKDNVKIDLFGKLFEHCTFNKFDKSIGATVATKVGDDDLTLTVRAENKKDETGKSSNHLRGDFGFSKDDWFVGYRHETNLDGDNKGTSMSMGALKWKCCKDATLFARSDIYNRFVNFGLDSNLEGMGRLTVENFFGLSLPKSDDPAKQKKHPGYGNTNWWLKACFTSELSKETSFKQRINVGNTWDNYTELKHKVNDNITVGVNHKFHSSRQGVKDDKGNTQKATDIGMTFNYKL